MTSRNLISHVYKARKFVMAILHGKQGLLCDKTFPKQALVFSCVRYMSLENTVGKGEIARNEQFLLFPHRFLPLQRTLDHFHQIHNCRLQNLTFEKGLKTHYSCCYWRLHVFMWVGGYGII